MDELLLDSVRGRARERCEYCHFPEAFAELPFHLDHVVARQHGGRTISSNLAWTCCFCNRYKGPNLSGVDPLTERVVKLFNPRSDVWDEHFQWDGAELVGNTTKVRATIRVLAINRQDAIAVRQLLMQEGVFSKD